LVSTVGGDSSVGIISWRGQERRDGLAIDRCPIVQVGQEGFNQRRLALPLQPRSGTISKHGFTRSHRERWFDEFILQRHPRT
jgi:hypothetical protein